MTVVFTQPGAGRFPRLAPTFAAATLVAAFGLFSALPIHAAHLGVSPTLVDIPAAQPAAGVRISNQDPETAIQVQARLFRWQQQDGQEVYTPTDDLILSPPVTRIEPGRENLIRLIRNGPAPEAGERSYRLLLDELPAPVQDEGSAQTEASASLNVVIRQSIPVFVTHPQATPAAPQWQIERVNGTEGGQAGYRVSVHNTGDKRLRLADLTLTSEDGEVLAQRTGLVGYALGHARMQFLIPAVEGAGTAATSLMLSVQTEKSALSAGPLPVHPDGH